MSQFLSISLTSHLSRLQNLAFKTTFGVTWIDADDRLIPHSDLVECNYSSILYQPVSPDMITIEYADSKVRRYMNMELMVKMVWMRLA
jgi:hypothetical protein